MHQLNHTARPLLAGRPKKKNPFPLKRIAQQKTLESIQGLCEHERQLLALNKSNPKAVARSHIMALRREQSREESIYRFLSRL